jgi:hypothetical protein
MEGEKRTFLPAVLNPTIITEINGGMKKKSHLGNTTRMAIID